jgi:hypothetical protein
MGVASYYQINYLSKRLNNKQFYTLTPFAPANFKENEKPKLNPLFVSGLLQVKEPFILASGSLINLN